MKTRILIVEDHDIFRMGLIELINLEKDLTVCGECNNVEGSWKMVNELNPDLVLVDISLKESNGLELIKKINSERKNLPVLVLSMHDEALYAERSLLAGARGYIMKQETSASVINAIRSVLEGKIYVSEKITINILNFVARKSSTSNKLPVESLTNRELEVFSYIGQGITTKEIAQKLFLSVKTIGTYRERIKQKLNLKNVNELIQQASHWVSTQ
ncbi:response regulator transcription factor [bacterium]|nr:response regulator transcription factor [bacterium]